MTDDELGRMVGSALQGTSVQLAAAEPGLDLATAVRRVLELDEQRAADSPVPRLREVVRPRRLVRPVLRPPAWQRAAAPVAAAVVLMTGILIFSPGARHAVADFLGIGGVKIEVTPGALPSNLGSDLNLGQRVTLAEAQRQVPFQIVLPHTSNLNRPDQVYLSTQFIDGQVYLVYGPRPGIPKADTTGTGVLLSEFDATIQEDYVKKLVQFEDTVEFVSVGDYPGYWIEGAPHELEYVDSDGVPIPDSGRLAGNTLIWVRAGVTLRLESSLSKAQALHIAGTVH